jgi:hypothetical protein
MSKFLASAEPWRGSARPYRHEVRRTITAAGVRALGGQALAQLADAGSTASTRAAPTTDLFHRARSIIDDRVDVAVRGGVAEAYEHLKLIMLFKTGFVKGKKISP